MIQMILIVLLAAGLAAGGVLGLAFIITGNATAVEMPWRLGVPWKLADSGEGWALERRCDGPHLLYVYTTAFNRPTAGMAAVPNGCVAGRPAWER